MTDPIERSKGYEISLVSFHQDRKALEDYQASDEHHRCVKEFSSEIYSKLTICRITSQYLWPYKDDVTRFDFEVDAEDEYICEAMVRGVLGRHRAATP